MTAGPVTPVSATRLRPVSSAALFARRAHPRGGVAIALGLIGLALAVMQRPGQVVFDTRIELSADIGLFLDRIGQVWSPTVDLGHVQSGQFVGYLFPMGPWFAAWNATGLPLWIGQRIWLGLLLGAAAIGAARLVADLFDRHDVGTRLAAGCFYIATPYVVVFAGGSSITLLAYAGLPWLMLAVHRGALTPRNWRWPAVAGVLVGATVGGVNAAVLVWVVLGALMLLLYEWLVLGRPGRVVIGFLGRAAACTALASAWWALPVALQAAYGADFLRFTEGPETIWATTSLSESIRGLGYWLLYLGVGGHPVRSVAGTYLYDTPVVLATFALPLLAVSGFRKSRNERYGPFFALLAAGTLVVMAAGFPEGAPMRRVLSAVYYGFEPVQFLRTTYKAAPLLALSLALLGAVALRDIVDRIRPGGRRLSVGGAAAVVALAGVALLPGLPFVTNDALERDDAYGTVPHYWRAAVADADRTTARDRRVMVLPGALFGWYTWGHTVNSIAPAISKRPVLAREVVRYADDRASQLQAEIDDLVQQGRLVPGQLDPLFRLLGVGTTLVSSDYLPAQSGSIDRASLGTVLSGQDGFDEPAGTYGKRHLYVPAGGRGGRVAAYPDIARFAFPGRTGPGIVRIHPRGEATVMAGDAQGVAQLAAVGRLDPARALFYAGDLPGGRLRRLVRDRATLVFTDSNRRRVLETNQLRANRGPTVGPNDELPREFPAYTLFPGGEAAQTVALYSGLRYLRAPLHRSFALFPEHRPYAAVDGRLDTSWLASDGTYQPEKQRWIELGFAKPRSIGTLRVYPQSDLMGFTDEIAISLNGGRERRFRLHTGANRLDLGASSVRRLRVRVLGTTGFADGPGGIAEIAVPGLRVAESLRLPTDLADALRGTDTSANPMLIAVERTTADFPSRAGAEVGDPQAASQLDMVDAEPGIERQVRLPSARRFRLGGWASIDPGAQDERIDALAGLVPGWRFSSSGRFEGVPARRAASAFDGDPHTAWIGDSLPGRFPMLEWSGPGEESISSLRLLPGPAWVGSPRRVSISTPRGQHVTARVGDDGRVDLGRALRARGLRILVLESKPPASPRAEGRALRATAIGEVVVPGAQMPHVPRSGPIQSRCGDLRVDGPAGSAPARMTGSIEALDAGRPLRIQGCGRGLLLPAGDARLHAPPGRVARPDQLLLASAAQSRGASAIAAPGRVVDPGSDTVGGRRDGVRVKLDQPAWVVLGESYSRGWRAWCSDAAGRERALGAPLPIDGFANGWRAAPSCERMRFRFAPQRAADLSYALSAAGVLTLLLLVLLGPGGGASRLRPDAGALVVRDPIRRLGIRAAIALALVAGAAGALVFALRAGAGLALLTFALARLGVNVRRLVALTIVALAALPVLYLLRPAPEQSDFTFVYPLHHIGAHWAAVAGVCCLAVASAWAALELRSSTRARG